MKYSIYLFAVLFVLSCNTTNTDPEPTDPITEPNIEETVTNAMLTKIAPNVTDDKVAVCGYINEKGDTIVPLGKYQFCFNDTITSFGAVVSHDNTFKGINPNGKELFDIYPYDNGPDYVADGMFRIVDGDKIGYANEKGEIVIAPQFKCTYPFENGQAKVATTCDLVPDGEHTMMVSESWYSIDKEGNKVE